jgi:endonuclease/exonuclease/phosphatase family metal-dependent hydrolase
MSAQNPDIVSLQELNGYTGEKLAGDAKAWGHDYSVLLKTTGFPTGITSRYPITDVKRIMDGMHHGLLRCRIRGIWFYVIHMHPSDYARRVDEVRILQRDIRGLPEKEPRIVLAGDFNGFSPADRFHYDTDEKLIEFFEMLDRRDTARNLNAGRLDYGGLDAIAQEPFLESLLATRTTVRTGDSIIFLSARTFWGAFQKPRSLGMTSPKCSPTTSR